MRHASTVFAAIEADYLLSAYIALDCVLALDLDLIGLVVGPYGSVAPADGAEALQGWFAERWECEADGFAVACYA